MLFKPPRTPIVKSRFSKLNLPRVFGEIVSIRQFFVAFVLLQISGYLVTWYLTDGLTISPHTGVLSRSVVIFMILASFSGVVEELFFRGSFKLCLGDIGLIVGSVIWVMLHQFKFATPIASPTTLIANILSAIFFFKLWRGRWWWVAVTTHALWNPLVITLKNLYGLC